MAYVVVVFAIINSAVLALLGFGFLYLREEMITQVQSAIQEEIRRQDDRIEKRVAKREGMAANGEEPTLPEGTRTIDNLRPGRPYRR